MLENLRADDFYVDRSVRDKYLKNIDLSGTYYYEFQIKRADGKIIWGRDYPRAVIDDEGKVKYFTGVLIDITSQKIAEEKLQRVLLELERSNRERKKMISQLESLSLQDDLTGLYNRRGFFTVSQKFFHLADRKKNKMFLLFMDLDDLKKINDTWGHQKGDLALKKTAALLIKTFRKSDILGRMGGDEFAVFPIGSTYSGVENAIHRLHKNLEEINSTEEAPFHLSVSMGVSCYDPEFPCSLDELFLRADKLMYAEKNSKQN
jgi:diguanylate cyclase (GGDEF)-like protein